MTVLNGPPPISAGEGGDEVVAFGGLQIGVHPDVLAPRPWTVAQSRWAARLAGDLPDGPVLELYAGGGQIGLEVARLTGRPVVQVEASAVACQLAYRNAVRNGLDRLVTIRQTRVGTPFRRRPFALVLADPPYVPLAEVDRYPEDPRRAIDGGPDGLDHLRHLVRALPRYLTPTTPVLVQVRGAHQAQELGALLRRQGSPLLLAEVHAHGPDRAVARLAPR